MTTPNFSKHPHFGLYGAIVGAETIEQALGYIDKALAQPVTSDDKRAVLKSLDDAMQKCDEIKPGDQDGLRQECKIWLGTDVIDKIRAIISAPDTQTVAAIAIEFPYSRTFDAIAEAVKVNPSGSIGISVQKFQDRFNRDLDRPVSGVDLQAIRECLDDCRTEFDEPSSDGDHLDGLLQNIDKQIATIDSAEKTGGSNG